MNGKQFATVSIALPLCLWGVTQLRIPVDRKAMGEAEVAVRRSGGLPAYRRWLEFYPNEPLVQAGFYRAIGLLDAAHARQFETMALQVDPSMAAKGDRAAALEGIGQAVQRVQTMGGNRMVTALTPAQLQTMMEPRAAFPPLPVGAPGYRQAPIIQPMPGYAWPEAMASSTRQAAPVEAPPLVFATPPPNSQNTPSARGQAAPPKLSQPAPLAMPPSVQPESQLRTLSTAAPYRAPAGYAAGATRVALRVFHDHSRAGDAEYFGPTCGALLVVAGRDLTFTPGGGEEPLVIPGSEVVEIGLNSAVGTDAGAFHILTRKGLYLHLAPEAATADEGRANVDELRKQLGLNQ